MRQAHACSRNQIMLTSVEGVYRDGKVELLQVPADIQQARVIVTFLPTEGPIDLHARGIGEEEAAELRWRFGAGAADWDDPAMDIYNDYQTR
jgi:hypothetical protein